VNTALSKYKVQWVTQYDNFVQLKSQWNHLAQIFSKHFFYRHEWFDSTWQWCHQSHEIKILLILSDNLLVGILPLMVKVEKYNNIRFRQCDFLSIPDTQVCDLMILPAHHQHASAVIIHALFCQPEWDKLKLHYLPSNSKLAQVFKWQNINFYLTETTKHPTVKIDNTWSEFYNNKSRRLKKGNNLARNHLQKQGHIEILNLNTYPEDKLLKVIQDISQKSWKQSTQTTFNHNGPFQFIQRLSHLSKQNQWLNIWALQLNNHIIAYEYQIEFQNNIYALRSDYLDTMRHLSPGTYLNWQILQKIFESEKSQYYMGPGQNSYKLRWQNNLKPVYTLVAYQHTVTGKLLETIEQRIIPKVKPLKKRMHNIFSNKIKEQQSE